MKEYTVYFIIKKNNHAYINEEVVTAKNKKEAFKIVSDKVKENTGCHAFHLSCQKPEIDSCGLWYEGLLYPQYSSLFNQLW